MSDVGLIETLRVFGGGGTGEGGGGGIPWLERHVARITGSLRALGLPLPPDDLRAAVRAAAAQRGGGDCVVRLEIAGGRVHVAVRDVPAATPPRVMVARGRHAPYLHKTTRRAPFDRALREAERAGCDDALLVTSHGDVAEGTVWNVFWWGEDGVCTPAASLGILPGIGRQRIMELVKVEEVRAPVEVLAGRASFLVNAVRGVVPLAVLAGRPVAADPRTAELARRFWPG